MHNRKINLLFLLSKTKRNTKGECPIKCRITFQKQRKEFSTGYFTEEEKWSTAKQKLIGKNTSNINVALSLIRQRIEQVNLELSVIGKNYTVEDIFIRYNGEDENANKTLLSVFQTHIERMTKLIGIEYRKATIIKYETTRDHVKRFIQWKYNKNDILLDQLKLNFLVDFDFYMKSERNIRQVTINKFIQHIKTVIKTAMGEGFLLSNPFILYKPKRAKLTVVFLSTEELNLLANYHFSQERLGQVRDCYIFCCYTGLPYLEMASLKKENIIKGFDGNLWISMYRQKTSKELMIPLLPQAKAILDLYASNDTEELLPIISNQKFNSYLKEIAEIVGINKNLTHHTARKTFASTVLLYNNVPIEVVSELLGHSKITVTQEHYGRVVKKRVSEEIQKLLDKT